MRSDETDVNDPIRVVNPHLARSKSFFCWRLRNRTRGPPPFSSMTSKPAALPQWIPARIVPAPGQAISTKLASFRDSALLPKVYLLPLPCLFDLAASANSIRRRIASERETRPACVPRLRRRRPTICAAEARNQLRNTSLTYTRGILTSPRRIPAILGKPFSKNDSDQKGGRVRHGYLCAGRMSASGTRPCLR
jgi:hypothetical protein